MDSCTSRRRKSSTTIHSAGWFGIARRFWPSLADRAHRTRFQTRRPRYVSLFRIPAPRFGPPQIVELSHPSLRRVTRFQVEPGEGTPRRFNSIAISRGL
ncbi:MAG TPA: hypothetical protein VMM36_16435 [Opitutaceae bacterium]|nr:hypothetical protein [Opitutaceae bacterium]